MTPKALRIAAETLYRREAIQGPGPLTALYGRIGAPKSTFDNWISGKIKVPKVAATFINDLLRWSAWLDDPDTPNQTRRFILAMCRADPDWETV